MASDTFETTTSTDEPFFTGSTNPGIDDTALPVSLAGRGFLIDLDVPSPPYGQEFLRRSVNLLNTQQSQTSGDQALIPPEVWRRSVDTWTKGAGQERYDRDSSDPARFRDSQGIDCWTPWQLTLLRDTQLVQALTAGACITETVNGAYVVLKGTAGYWYDGTTVTPFTLPSAAVSASSDGTRLLVVTADGHVYSYTSTASPATLISSGLTVANAVVVVIKGLVLLGNGNKLYDITAGPGVLPAALYTHPNTNLHWTAGCDGLASGYLVGGSGDRWYVFSITLDPTTFATFAPPVVAASLPDGEVPYAVASYLGNILIGTGRGWRLAVAASDNSLTFGRLIQTESAVRCFEGQDRFVWYGQSSAAGAAGLGRADLSVFASALTPAYANDLREAAPGVVSGAGTIGGGSGFGHRIFTVEGVGIFREVDALVPSGSLFQGGIAFGASDPKVGMYAQLFTEPIPGGGVSLQASYDDSTPQEVGVQMSAGGKSVGNASISETFLSIEMSYVLTRDSLATNQGPVVTRTEVRALVVPGRATEWQIPLRLREVIEYNGATTYRSVEDDYDFLLDLVRTRREFEYREGTRLTSLHATDFLWIPDKETSNLDTYVGTFILSAKEIS